HLFLNVFFALITIFIFSVEFEFRYFKSIYISYTPNGFNFEGMKMVVNNHKSGDVLGSLLCLNVCEDLELLLRQKKGNESPVL
ncbi:hypothetical protein MKX03_026696, partial [Papaver bracteatum]